MRLVIFSHFFAPGIGGVEKQVLSLARGLAQKKPLGESSNFEVTVITNTPGKDANDLSYSFDVTRCPNFIQLWRLIRQADVVHFAGPSLLPLLISRLLRKPTVIGTSLSVCQNYVVTAYLWLLIRILFRLPQPELDGESPHLTEALVDGRRR